MELADFLPVLIQILLALGIGSAVLIASHIFGQRTKTNKLKDAAYECGLPADGRPGARFSVKFYVVAMLFILFDIEVVFVLPLVMVYRDFLANQLPIFLPFMFFMLLMVVGLFYEMKKGALDWEK